MRDAHSLSSYSKPMASRRTMLLQLLLLLLDIAFLTIPASAFSSKRLASMTTTASKHHYQRTLPLPFSTTTTLYVSQNDNEKATQREEGGTESEEDLQRRMAVVRSLQMSFYGKDAQKEDDVANDDTDNSIATKSTFPDHQSLSGSISNLPLFRAAWYELPGRSNILILRDPIYTNMFERIIYRGTMNSDENINNTNTNDNDSSSQRTITPLVFGHVYTPKQPEKKKKKSKETTTRRPEPAGLKVWNETTIDTIGDENSCLSEASVLGTLMYIRDYRRLRDGRILALVQAAEKFAIQTIRQTLPYAIADVQVLPDVEEIDLTEAATKGEPNDIEETKAQSNMELSSLVYSCDEPNNNDENDNKNDLAHCLRANESIASLARARAVWDSLNLYHEIECDPEQRLDGIPSKSDLTIADITHDAISKALPYCRFATTASFVDKESVISNSTMAVKMTDVLEFEKQIQSRAFADDGTDPVPSLEFQLLQRGITKIPPSDRRFTYNQEPTYDRKEDESGDHPLSTTTKQPSWTTDEFEYELWLVLDDFLVATKKQISPILLALLPDENFMPKPWPSGFRLHKLLEKQRQSGKNLNNHSVYPHHRRQRRFSYSAAHLLEGILPIDENSSDGNGNTYTTFETDEIQKLRALLLSVPSTRQRLRVVLETFHRWRLYQECNEFA